MKPHIISAAILLVALLLVSQCVVIGGMAFASAQQSGQAERNFYSGMYTLCWDAYQGYGYPDGDVVDACNAHVAEERDLKTHLKPAAGYQP